LIGCLIFAFLLQLRIEAAAHRDQSSNQRFKTMLSDN